MVDGRKKTAPPVTVSLCMIVRNEEAVLARCLDSVRGVFDQLVIVDTGSEDTTVSIAKRYTDEVYSIPWRNDFGGARNVSFSYAKCDYIIYLDADDVLPPEERDKLTALKMSLAEQDAKQRPRTVLMRYDVPEAGGVSYRSRMVARREGVYWHNPIHEYIDCEPPVMETDILVLHRKLVQPAPDRNCGIIRAIPRETLKADFWLSAQCFLDMTLAGHPDEANGYFQMCAESYAGDANTCLQLAETLNHHRLWDEALRWVLMSRDGEDAENAEIRTRLLQQGVKACAGLGKMDDGRRYNEKVLHLNPDNRAALVNRIFFAR